MLLITLWLILQHPHLYHFLVDIGHKSIINMHWRLHNFWVSIIKWIIRNKVLYVNNSCHLPCTLFLCQFILIREPNQLKILLYTMTWFLTMGTYDFPKLIPSIFSFLRYSFSLILDHESIIILCNIFAKSNLLLLLNLICKIISILVLMGQLGFKWA